MANINRSTEEWQAVIGGFIRDARIARELDQQELADRASISRLTLSRMENGGTTTITTFINVLRALGRTDWLESLDETGGEISPLALAREQRTGPKRRQRVARKAR